MREYERTHPWITFELNLERLPWHLWMLLGEAQSKLEHLAGAPLRPTTAARLHLLYLAKGAQATTAIEGNTLSEQDVIAHLDGQLDLPPSKEYLGKEIDNIVRACQEIWDQGTSPVTTSIIKEFNRQALAGLSVGDEVSPGQFRRHSVGVARYRGAPAADCDYLIDKLCAWVEDPSFRSQPSALLAFAVLKAVLAHLYLAWIHPFGDGNGRTARLIEFKILVASGVPTPAAHLLSNHYNETRAEYYRQLDYASKSGGDVVKFIHYAVQGFVDGLRAQIELVKAQQWDVTWRNFVHEQLGRDGSPASLRKRHLLLDLSLSDQAVPKNELLAISPRVAKEYAGLTPKTLDRDIQDLLEKGLLVKEKSGLRANKERILAFLPVRHAKPGDSVPDVAGASEKQRSFPLPGVNKPPK